MELVYCPVAGLREESNKALGSINDRDFLHDLRDCRSLTQGPVPFR